MKLNLNLITTLGIFATASIAMAEPTLYPKDLNVLSGVTNNTNSNILADEVDPNTIWVMPPNTASAVVSGMHSKTANMGFCAEMRDQQTYSRELSKEINAVMKRKKEKEGALIALQEKADKLNIEAQGFAAEKNLTVLSDLDTRISDADTRLSELYVAAESCQSACDQINDDIEVTVAGKKELIKQRNQITKQNTEDIRQYVKLNKKAEAARQAFRNANGIYLEITRELDGVRAQFFESYKTFGQMDGAKANFLYESNWDANVQSLRDENPGRNFAKVATKKALLKTEIAGLDGIDPTASVKAIQLGADVQNGIAEFTAYPESISANVALSLIGACPMEHPEYFDLKSNDVHDMKYGMIITYEFDTIFTLKAEASYNMYKMYQKIVSSGSKGGLFRSKSWTNVEERNFFSDTYSFKWSDRENSLSLEEKDVIEQEMRHEVMWRLANLALPDSPNRGDVMALLPPPKRGAAVASEQLMKTCPGNIYCAAGAAVLTVLDAIFGSSSSTSTYTKINNADIHENYETTQKVTKSWVTSYL